MPQLNNTIKYIISELDELEREDQYRIKKVKDIRSSQEEEESALKAAEDKDVAKQIANKTAGAGADGTNKSAIQTEQFAVDALLD